MAVSQIRMGKARPYAALLCIGLGWWPWPTRPDPDQVQDIQHGQRFWRSDWCAARLRGWSRHHGLRPDVAVGAVAGGSVPGDKASRLWCQRASRPAAVRSIRRPPQSSGWRAGAAVSLGIGLLTVTVPHVSGAAPA